MPICGKVGISSSCISSADVGQRRPCPKPSDCGQPLRAMSENYLDLVSNMGSMIRTSISDGFELMPRIFAYVRVSTTGQTTENQIREIEAAGFTIEPRRVVSETISGSIAATQRRGFVRLMDKLETGDILVVTKLDRLGRNAMDVRATVDRLAGLGVRVHCLALGGSRPHQRGGEDDHAGYRCCRRIRARSPRRANSGGLSARQSGRKISRPPGRSLTMISARMSSGDWTAAHPFPPWRANTPRVVKLSYERATPWRRDFGQGERRHACENSASDHDR